MKQLKKLTRYHKVRLSKKNLDPNLYALKREDNESFTVVLKDGTGGEVTFNKS